MNIMKNLSTLPRRVNISRLRQYTTYSQLPEEHRMLYEMCRKFADEILTPNAGKWDKTHTFPKEAVQQLVSSMQGCIQTSDFFWSKPINLDILTYSL